MPSKRVKCRPISNLIDCDLLTKETTMCDDCKPNWLEDLVEQLLEIQREADATEAWCRRQERIAIGVLIVCFLVIFSSILLVFI